MTLNLLQIGPRVHLTEDKSEAWDLLHNARCVVGTFEKVFNAKILFPFRKIEFLMANYVARALFGRFLQPTETQVLCILRSFCKQKALNFFLSGGKFQKQHAQPHTVRTV